MKLRKPRAFKAEGFTQASIVHTKIMIHRTFMRRQHVSKFTVWLKRAAAWLKQESK